MFMLFTCEHCGARIKVDGRSQGKRGRCSKCGHVMVIPHIEAHAHEPAHASDAPFRLSPPDERPAAVHVPPPILVEPEHLERHVTSEEFHEFELTAGDANPEAAALASPEVRRGLRELDEFQKDPRPYNLVDGLEKSFLARWDRGSGPAGWLVVKWRQGVGLILRLLRWIDDWAYLISVPFIILAIFAIAIQNRGLVHTGAVVVVLANYGRFWTDLLAIFVRPFKEGPIHGLAFLFPPYGIYYLWTRLDKFKPTLRRLITSCIPIVLVVLAYAYLPFVNPAAKDAKGLPEKILSGERELIHEIRDDLKEVEEKIPSLEKRESSEEKATP
jgi:predicted Zn finger-like uncharacterized protein